jgi:hypothetical protein
VRDKPKTIGQGNDEVELRKLSPEERARRRFRYNLLVWTFCFVILFVVFLVLVWPAIRDS